MTDVHEILVRYFQTAKRYGTNSPEAKTFEALHMKDEHLGSLISHVKEWVKKNYK